MGSRRANTLLQTGHSSLDFSSLPSRRPTEHSVLTRVWHRDPLPCSAHTRVMSRSSLSILQPTTSAHTHSKASNKEKQPPKSSAIASSSPHLPRDKSHKGILPWQYVQYSLRDAGTLAPPSGRARLYTQRTGTGLASGPGTSALPRMDPGFSSTPSHPAKGTILYSTRGEPSGW